MTIHRGPDRQGAVSLFLAAVVLIGLFLAFVAGR